MLTILDWDGVVIDSFDQLFFLCCTAQKTVNSGRPFEKNDLRWISSLTLHDLARRIKIEEELIETFFSTFFKLQQENSKMSRFFPGIVEALKEIATKCKLAIVSSNSQWEIERYLKSAGIQNLFQKISYGTDKRPKSEKITETINELDSAKSTTYMVGDCRSDISQGKKAGVKTVAVTWGYQPKEALLFEKPDIIVDNISNFLKIF